MSKATILFYKGNLVNPIFKKVVAASGISKTEFTALLCSMANKVCREKNFDSFSFVERKDTITEVKK